MSRSGRGKRPRGVETLGVGTVQSLCVLSLLSEEAFEPLGHFLRGFHAAFGVYLEHPGEILHAEQVLGAQLARLDAPQDILQLAQSVRGLDPGRSIRLGGCIRSRSLSWSESIRFMLSPFV